MAGYKVASLRNILMKFTIKAIRDPFLSPVKNGLYNLKALLSKDLILAFFLFMLAFRSNMSLLTVKLAYLIILNLYDSRKSLTLRLFDAEFFSLCLN